MYLEKLLLTDQVAVVTGGAQGIGLACAEALLEAGARAVITDRDTAIARKASDTLAAKGYEPAVVTMDVTDTAQVREVAKRIAQDYGRIDILINSAGIARSQTPAEEVEDEHWRNVIDVNLNGTFWCCREFGRPMLRAASGSIVNIGSMSGLIVNKPQAQSYYNASKAAVHQLTRSLAAEWAPRGVRVNAVAPTYIDTPLNSFAKEDPNLFGTWIASTPMARLGKTDEVASVVLFLASSASSLMTGAIVVADGGYTCW